MLAGLDIAHDRDTVALWEMADATKFDAVLSGGQFAGPRRTTDLLAIDAHLRPTGIAAHGELTRSGVEGVELRAHASEISRELLFEFDETAQFTARLEHQWFVATWIGGDPAQGVVAVATIELETNGRTLLGAVLDARCRSLASERERSRKTILQRLAVTLRDGFAEFEAHRLFSRWAA